MIVDQPPQAPAHLSLSAPQWGTTTVETYVLGAHHLRLLQLACEAWDRAQHHGALLSDGVPSILLNDPAVIKAYLGTKFAKRHQAEIEQQLQSYQNAIEKRGSYP